MTLFYGTVVAMTLAVDDETDAWKTDGSACLSAARYAVFLGNCLTHGHQMSSKDGDLDEGLY